MKEEKSDTEKGVGKKLDIREEKRWGNKEVKGEEYREGNREATLFVWKNKN